eukprot:CAMPEP_0172179216 /NCGR_PEP_ID=MMETSP1050-20130122/16488_1 /TAXON_ID=233186 /ORGANISM="Cryptomonas curvata, Strain CCAP979/52" /LENGTH=224 /DNA_ID=CAMNT_0012852061 /DNA_START=45 /DNA_END=716 /DNA_ORIENTATION=+
MSWAFLGLLVMSLVCSVVAADDPVRPCRLCCQKLGSCIYPSDASKQETVLHSCCGSNRDGKYFCCPQKVGSRSYACKGKTGKCSRQWWTPSDTSPSQPAPSQPAKANEPAPETNEVVNRRQDSDEVSKESNPLAALIVGIFTVNLIYRWLFGKGELPNAGAGQVQTEGTGPRKRAEEKPPSKENKKDPQPVTASQAVVPAPASRTTRSLSIGSVDFDFDIDADW